MDGEKLGLIAAVCVFAAALCRLFDNGAKEYGVLIKTIVSAGVMTAVAVGITPVLREIEELYSATGGSGEYLTILMKSLGICFLTQLAADICRDSGESALATQAEAAGKTALFVIALPLFHRAAELARELI